MISPTEQPWKRVIFLFSFLMDERFWNKSFFLMSDHSNNLPFFFDFLYADMMSNGKSKKLKDVYMVEKRQRYKIRMVFIFFALLGYGWEVFLYPK